MKQTFIHQSNSKYQYYNITFSEWRQYNFMCIHTCIFWLVRPLFRITNNNSLSSKWWMPSHLLAEQWIGKELWYQIWMFGWADNQELSRSSFLLFIFILQYVNFDVEPNFQAQNTIPDIHIWISFIDTTDSACLQPISFGKWNIMCVCVCVLCCPNKLSVDAHSIFGCVSASNFTHRNYFQQDY